MDSTFEPTAVDGSKQLHSRRLKGLAWNSQMSFPVAASRASTLPCRPGRPCFASEHTWVCLIVCVLYFLLRRPLQELASVCFSYHPFRKPPPKNISTDQNHLCPPRGKGDKQLSCRIWGTGSCPLAAPVERHATLMSPHVPAEPSCSIWVFGVTYVDSPPGRARGEPSWSGGYEALQLA